MADAPLSVDNTGARESELPVVSPGHVAIDVDEGSPGNGIATEVSYLEKVERLKETKGPHGLSELSGWMKHRYILYGEWQSSKITLIQDYHGSERRVTTLDGSESLKAALHNEDMLESDCADSGSHQGIKLLIIEDISGDLVEFLGLHYNIDPRFFADHVHSFVRRREDLLASTIHQQWFQIRNVRLCRSNIYRPADIARNADRRSSPLPGSEQMGANETRTSIWIGQDCTCSNTTIGIILLDHTEFHARHTNHVVSRKRDACIATFDLDAAQTSTEQPLPRTWYEDIVDMTVRYPWFNQPESTDPADKLQIVCPALYTTCGEWLELTGAVRFAVERIDSRRRVKLETGHTDRSTRDLRTLGLWSECIPRWREMASETAQSGIAAARRLTQEPSPNSLDAIVPDFERVLRRFDEVEKYINGAFERGTAELQLLAARESLAESHDLARLSWLATIFIPLTFITGLFSMSEDLESMRGTFKTYFTTAIPVTLVALVIARWGSFLSRSAKRLASEAMQKILDARYYDRSTRKIMARLRQQQSNPLAEDGYEWAEYR